MSIQPFDAAAECLRVLAHPQRLRIVAILRDGPRAVGELATFLSVQSHVMSEHLRLLQRCGFLASNREGRSVQYQLAEPHLLAILACVETRFGKEELYEHHNNRKVRERTQRRRRAAAA